MKDREGYVKLYRCLLDSRAFQNEGLLKVWIWCLLRANHKEEWFVIVTGRGETEVLIEPGQFVFGRKSAARELHMKESSVRNRIEKLERMGNITINKDSHYSIISIMNWGTYQVAEEKKDAIEDRQRTGKGQAKDTNKNDKNDKKKKLIIDFETFWEAYPARGNPPVRSGKSAALKSWQSLDKKNELPELEVIMSSLNSAKSCWVEPQFIPMASTWLNGKRWEDEICQPKQANVYTIDGQKVIM